jgi:hypothetical protein
VLGAELESVILFEVVELQGVHMKVPGLSLLSIGLKFHHTLHVKVWNLLFLTDIDDHTVVQTQESPHQPASLIKPFYYLIDLKGIA